MFFVFATSFSVTSLCSGTHNQIKPGLLHISYIHVYDKITRCFYDLLCNVYFVSETHFAVVTGRIKFAWPMMEEDMRVLGLHKRAVAVIEQVKFPLVHHLVVKQ